MNADRTFSHRDPGTDEATWLLDGRWDAVPRLGLAEVLTDFPNVMLVAPHPDDETLALGATLADLANAGVAVTVVVVTHGSGTGESAVRRHEATCALAELSSRIGVLWCEFPDGALGAHEDALIDLLSDVIDSRTLILAPADDDGHGDHEAVARAAEAAARRQQAALLTYPVWLWHWARPDDIDWTRLRVLAPTRAGLLAKTAAIDCYTSQLTSSDDYPIVGPAVLARARRLFETVIVPRASDLAARIERYIAGSPGRAHIAEPFDDMIAGGDNDPWLLDSSFYEQRRLALVLACLGRERYRSALEIGCSTGQLSNMLADRADDVTGLDVSAAAIRIARRRFPGVRWSLGAAPGDIPDGRYDLIVLSEIGYFLDGPDLLTTLRTARRLKRCGGEIVLAHWRLPTSGIPLDGELVHRQAAAVLDVPLRASYRDADLLIEVWGDPGSVHHPSGAST